MKKHEICMAKLARIKTTETNAPVEVLLTKIANEQQQKDSQIILKMMQKATGENQKCGVVILSALAICVMKAPKTGRQVDWLKIGFSHLPCQSLVAWNFVNDSTIRNSIQKRYLY